MINFLLLLKGKNKRSNKMSKRQNIIFKKGGFVCQVEQDMGEAYEHYLERGYFVVSQRPQNDKEYGDAIKYSRIYMNVKIDRCKYNNAIMKKLAEYEANFMVS